MCTWAAQRVARYVGVVAHRTYQGGVVQCADIW